MDFLSAQELAKKWGISPRNVVRYAKAGKLEGAKLIGGSWIIPADAVRPRDGRTKVQLEPKNSPEKVAPFKEGFRFPVYIYSRYYRHKELLSLLEQQLYEAQDLFFAGSYQESYKVLQELLPRTASSPVYFRLGCLYYLCIAAVYNEDCDSFTVYSKEIDAILKQDFPYKKEMEVYLPIFNYYYKGLGETYTFKLEPDYDYDADVLAIIYYNYFTQRILAYKDGEHIRQHDLHFFELLVKDMIKERSAATGVVLMLSILYLSFLCCDKKISLRYLDKILELAREGNCPELLVELLQYAGSPLKKRLRLYDKDMYKQVEKLWRQKLRGYIKIRKKLKLNNDFAKYTEDEIFLIGALAVDHTNVEIADFLDVKPNTVSKRINELYEKTGFSSRRDYKQLFYQLLF